MKEGLLLTNRLGCNSVIAESDSIVMIDACKGCKTWWAESVAIFVDCMDHVASIGNISFTVRGMQIRLLMS
jgi:hypothetical protein